MLCEKIEGKRDSGKQISSINYIHVYIYVYIFFFPNCRALSQRKGKNLALDLARKNFNYLTKNTPVHGKDLYIKTLISKSETFVKNIRWRAFF